MNEGSSLINLGDLSKPATALIEKVSEGLGGYFKPFQIKRIATAEAEAEIIRAQAQIEVTDLQRRALGRFLMEEAKKQDNMENITKEAIPQLEDSARPEDIEDDWITNFFDKCRIISDDEMQSLWAKVLSGEANSPGSYSKRTVNLLGSLDKSDARLFTSLCGFKWFLRNVVPLVFDVRDPIYNEKGINFDSLTHLDDIGLINFEPLAGFMLTGFSKQLTIHYEGTVLNLEFREPEDNDLDTGKVLLTKTGFQLSNICGSKLVEGFLDYVINKWAKKGIIFSSVLPTK